MLSSYYSNFDEQWYLRKKHGIQKIQELVCLNEVCCLVLNFFLINSKFFRRVLNS